MRGAGEVGGGIKVARISPRGSLSAVRTAEPPEQLSPRAASRGVSVAPTQGLEGNSRVPHAAGGSRRMRTGAGQPVYSRDAGSTRGARGEHAGPETFSCTKQHPAPPRPRDARDDSAARTPRGSRSAPLCAPGPALSPPSACACAGAASPAPSAQGDPGHVSASKAGAPDRPLCVRPSALGFQL